MNLVLDMRIELEDGETLDNLEDIDIDLVGQAAKMYIEHNLNNKAMKSEIFLYISHRMYKKNT
jgi:hypothetical protein